MYTSRSCSPRLQRSVSAPWTSRTTCRHLSRLVEDGIRTKSSYLVMVSCVASRYVSLAQGEPACRACTTASQYVPDCLELSRVRFGALGRLVLVRSLSGTSCGENGITREAESASVPDGRPEFPRPR